MRTPLLVLTAAVGFLVCVRAYPADNASASSLPSVVVSATAIPSAAASSSQPAVWIHRKAHVQVYYMECDAMVNLVRWALLRLGARASDLDIEVPASQCHHGAKEDVGVDATFSVLAPIDSALIAKLQARFGPKEAAAAIVEAKWQNVELVPHGYHLTGGNSGGGSRITGNGFGNSMDECFLPKVVKEEIVPLFFTKNATLTGDCNLSVEELTAGSLPDAHDLLRLEREQD